MNILSYCLGFCLLTVPAFAEVAPGTTSVEKSITTQINPDLEVQKLSEHLYLYTAWADIGKWGRVGSNGLIVVNKNKAYLIDTPMHEDQTIKLVEYIRKNLGASLVGFIPGHWHDDCVGGLAYLNREGVKTIASAKTNALLKEQKKPQAKETFDKELKIDLEGYQFECLFAGGGHSVDNIVVWFPKEKILFGGCLIKDKDATNLGNTDDAAPLPEWKTTIETLEKRFKDVKLVIPGHGDSSTEKGFEKTKELLNKALTPKK